MALIDEKIAQAAEILKEKKIDLWLTFVRESDTMPDPCLELMMGTSCTWQSAFIITAKGETIAIVGSLDVANQRDHGHYAEVIGYKASVKNDLLKVLQRLDPKTIAINYSEDDNMADGLTHGMYLALKKHLEATPFVDRLVSSQTVVSALRGRKSHAELNNIRGAVNLTLQMFDKVTGMLRPELTEKGVAEFLKKEGEAVGVKVAWDPSMCPAVFTGPESAGAHAGPTDRIIERGHLMNIDFGVLWNGYCSDLQRTWYFLREGESQAPEAVQQAFDAIRDAITLASEALRPGIECWTIDDIARRHIVECGFAEFPHGLGHQIGRKAHDGSGLLCPRWDRYGNRPYEIVEAGQVYTLEPRATVEGHGVATIEEIVVVTKHGCEYLSTRQTELILM